MDDNIDVTGGEILSIERVEVAAYKIPTDQPESDGTLEWNSTTIVVVRIRAGGEQGLGYTYADTGTATLIADKLTPLLTGRDATAITGRWQDMVHAIRDLGRPGIASMAISAVDAALWDLKARLAGVPLIALLGAVRNGVEVYGSGGFTSYSNTQLADQLGGWAAEGMRRVKMKVGREPQRDVARVESVREAIGSTVQLFVDGNGAYSRKQALALAEPFAAFGVSWFEEPVSSDDLEGLRLVRDRAPAEMDVAAGEYGYDQVYFRRMLAAGAVDVLQADATRCAGITGFMRAAALCEGFALPLSCHCAPALHVHPACAAAPVRHIEYFHDHCRIERVLFEGVPVPRQGILYPDQTRPGLGLELKETDARRYAL